MGSDMDTGLNNLDSILQLYTPRPSRVAYYCTESRPLSFVGSLLNSGSCPKCIRSWWLVGWIFKKSEYVKMAVISPGTSSGPKLPYENLKQLKRISS